MLLLHRLTVPSGGVAGAEPWSPSCGSSLRRTSNRGHNRGDSVVRRRNSPFRFPSSGVSFWAPARTCGIWRKLETDVLGRTSCSPEGAGVTTLWQKGEHLWAEMRGNLSRFSKWRTRPSLSITMVPGGGFRLYQTSAAPGKLLNAMRCRPSAEGWVSLALSDFAMWACCVHLKRASTGAWSLVPTSFWTKQAVARAASEMLTNT